MTEPFENKVIKDDDGSKHLGVIFHDYGSSKKRCWVDYLRVKLLLESFIVYYGIPYQLKHKHI